MTFNNSSVVNNTSLRSKYNIPLEITIFAAVAGIVLFFWNSVANGLLFMFVRSEQRKSSGRSTTAKTFILGTTIFSLLSVFGLFLDIILIICDHSPMLLCNILAFIYDHLMFLCYTFCAHFLACISLERYTVILRCRFQLKRHMHWFLPSLIIYIIITWLTIVAEDYYYAFIKGKTFCYLPNYEEAYKGSLHSFIVSIIVVSIWQTICNTIIIQCTSRTIREIKRQKNITRSVLGDQVLSLETKRLQVTYALAILFSLVWIPHGVQAALHSYIPIRIASSMYVITRVLVTGTFLVLPIVYYKMDKRFESFVKNRVRFLSPARVAPIAT